MEGWVPPPGNEVDSPAGSPENVPLYQDETHGIPHKEIAARLLAVCFPGSPRVEELYHRPCIHITTTPVENVGRSSVERNRVLVVYKGRNGGER